MLAPTTTIGRASIPIVDWVANHWIWLCWVNWHHVTHLDLIRHTNGLLLTYAVYTNGAGFQTVSGFGPQYAL